MPIVSLTPDELNLLVTSLDAQMYWELSDEDNRNNGAVLDDDADDEHKDDRLACKALQAKLEASKVQIAIENGVDDLLNKLAANTPKINLDNVEVPPEMLAALRNEADDEVDISSLPVRDPVTCTKCGGTNVQCAMWINPNTKEIHDDFGSWDETDTKFCEDCQINVELHDGNVEERELHEQFSDTRKP